MHDPALYIRTHLVTRKTLRFFFLKRDRMVGQIVQEDKSFTWFLIREGLRWVVFNGLTIPLIVRTIRAAETNRVAAFFVTPMLLRGTVSYFFLRGVSELRRRRTGSDAVPLPV